MRVLFLAEDCPFPPDNGGRLRTFSLLSRLSPKHEITLVAPGEHMAGSDWPSGAKPKRTIMVPPFHQRWWERLKSPLSPLPYIICKYRSPAMKAAVERELATGHYDLLHCDSTNVVSSVPANALLPKVLDAHNVEAVIWERYAREERRSWMIPLLRSQVAKVALFESQLPQLFDCRVTVSENDRQEMGVRYGYENISVCSNGVDLDFYRPLADPLTPVVAFICSFDYRPNKDAIRWFVEAIWQRIRTELPETKMLLVGRRPPRWLAALCAREDIILCSDVPDTRPYLARAALVVVPIRIGGGTRLKILEAMAAGRCVVSTTVGAEGLDVRDGEHLSIADDPADFARAVVSLLRDPARRQALAHAARALVEAEYGWDRAASQMEAAWDQARASFEISTTDRGGCAA